MGCFPSKKNVEDDKPRERVINNTEGRTVSTPIRNTNFDLGNETYAKSYDEFRMIENDAFIKNLKVKEEQEIVKKAAADMFDLSQLDGTNNEEIEEKEHLYRDIFTKLDTSRLKKFSLTKLNMGSIESDKNDDLSSDPFLEIVKNQSNNLRNSIKSICVADCGELIQNFPSLPSNA